ncbi:MAG: ATPase [Maritimibacter sp.]
MIYRNAKEWREAQHKQVLLFGMSGLGKTRLANILRDTRQWFHYSVDYRIGTRYMGEHITDNFKREAMKNPFLRELLMTDSVRIHSNITFDDLSPLSTYLGKPGNPRKGGLPFVEYMRRQAQHREAEISALMDSSLFIARSEDIYGYENFVCDTGGSICEVVDPDNENDPVLKELYGHLLMVWIDGGEAHTNELIRRFVKAPKPMYYAPDVLNTFWAEYLRENKVATSDVDPDDFMRASYAKALVHRQPIYAKMAENWGLRITAEQVSKVKSAEDFETLIAEALEAR